MRVLLNQGTQADCGEIVRKGFVNAMRSGDNLCVDMDKTKADFPAMSSEGNFTADKFFDYTWFEQEANYMPYVREDERHGPGGINPGIGFSRNPSFGMALRSGAENEEVLQEQIALIPNFDQFMHVIIE
uniref:Uncharacterized protein n=1 Tax=Favella ehrenbergii TaxID=182087 RepID=A0A7S3MIW4_9SPIT|mmetsp:Transcript_34447/g.45324  ORF Transcript_34447/g.45324 Transcript_34447/m.45324 type:complete len:129 (-) Transcript_34447:112-498(-)